MREEDCSLTGNRHICQHLGEGEERQEKGGKIEEWGILVPYND